MTEFEKFSTEMNVNIAVDKNGLYTGMCKALALMCNDVILSDDEKIRNLPWEEQKEIIKAKFYKTFPYMSK